MTADPGNPPPEPRERPSRRRRITRRALQLAGLAVAVVAAVVVVRTLAFRSKQLHLPPASDVAVDARAVAEHVGRAVRFQTVSYQDPARFDAGAFRGLHQFLESAYPRVHAALRREVVSDF